MQDKKALRRFYRELRDSITDKELKSSCAAEKILEFINTADIDTVLLYASFGSEVRTTALIDKLLASGKNVALPRCAENGSMTFHCISSANELHSGKYGIPEPDWNLPSPEITDKTVCIVPGLAFTDKGGRLGYGGGYYDRFTAAYPGLYTIGLTFDELVVTELPTLPHDLKVNAIATEERMVLCSAE